MNDLRQYELLFIISPKIADQEVDKLANQVKEYVAGLGAEIINVQRLGRRRLAYEIKHFREGHYVLIQFNGSGSEISELERRLRVTDDVLRYLTVRLDEDLRRADKMKQKRTRRVTVKSQAGAPKESGREEVFEEEEEEFLEDEEI
jgi:small subunit ribosomal protein S6